MDLLNEVDGDGDRGSFEDSDRFEEDDSVVSWSESESQINNWRGWDNIKTPLRPRLKTKETTVSNLVDLCCKTVAQNLPFELIELSNEPIPGDLQLKVISMSFPMDVEDIRLYSTLASGSADQFSRGEDLYNYKAVHDCLQIGFVLTARVHTEMAMTGPPGMGSNSVGGKPLNKFSVSIMFDRLKITSCSCTCMNGSQWCAHAVAVCLLRIFNPDQVQYRLPVSESLNRLTRDHLQKLIQYLLCQSPPTDILPAAQTILDQLLSPGPTEINESHGAPDLTCGGEVDSVAQWCLDEHSLADNVRKILSKFCVPAPVVYSDPAYLNSNLPAPAQEYQNLLRPLRGREPEGIWNLLCIIRAMFIRRDNNAVKLLRILTEALLELDKIVCWWYNVKMSLLSVYSRLPHSSSSQMNMVPNQYAAAKFCDEVVTLWRLAALNPALNRHERDSMANMLHDYHKRTVQQALKSRQTNLHHHHRSHHHHHHHPYFPGPSASSSPPTGSGSCQGQVRESWQASNRFPGFKPALEACVMDWGEFETWRAVHMPSVRPIPLPAHPSKPARSRSMSATTTGSGPSKETRKDGRRSRHASVRSVTTPATTQGSANAPAGGGKLLSSMEHSSSDGSSSEGFCEGGERLFAPVASSTATTSVTAPVTEGNVWLTSTSSITVVSGTVGAAEDSSSADESGYLRREASATSSVPLQHSLSQLSSAVDDMSEENFIFRLFAFCVALRGHGYEPESQALSYVLADDLLSRADDIFDSLSAISEEIIRTQQRLPANLSTSGKSGSGGGGGSGGKRYSPGGPGSSGGSRGAASSAANTFQEAAETVYPRGMTDHTTYVTKVLDQMQFLVNSLVDLPRAEKDVPSLAFQLCLYGICYPRPPAKNKAYEVKLFHLESELLTLLRKLPVYAPEVELLRVKTEEMIEGKLAHSLAYLPYSLAIYAFDIFTRFNTANIPGLTVTANEMKDLAFRCALKALEMKSELSEQYHPILIEGQRRQRDELALMLIVHYKDDEVHLSRVMESLLDRKLNANFKAPSLHACLTHNTHSLMNYSEPDTPHSANASPAGTLASSQHLSAPFYPSSNITNVTPPLPSSYSRSAHGRQSAPTCVLSVPGSKSSSSSSTSHSGQMSGRTSVTRQSAEYANYQMLVNYNKHRAPNAARRQQRADDAGQRGDTEDSSALEDEVDERLRCLDLRRGRDTTSSAPDTTSSDNSPTLPRRASRAALVAAAPQAAGTDGGSSSDGVSSSESEPPPPPPPPPPQPHPQPLMGQGIRGSRLSASHPVKTMHGASADPNQPSESMAYHMFELARSVLSRAGGAASSMAVFNHQANLAMDPGGPHRQLHLCAFQLGLYALGLYNSVNSTWQSRTYSSHVSWISNQVMDIGATALCILIHTWKHHLTPPEVANIADKATNTRDSATQSAAAELCLAALAECQTLNPSEIQRALRQCKEKSQEMLERGLSAVEKGATNTAGGVYPEVLFYVARQWYDLYELASVARNSMTRRSSAESEYQQPLPQQSPNVNQQPLPPTPQQHPALLHHSGPIQVQHPARHPTFQQQHPHQPQQQLYLSQAAMHVNGVPWPPPCPVPASPAPYSPYFYSNQLAVAAVAAACQARPPNPVTTAPPPQNPAVTLQQQQSAMAHLAVIAQIPTMGRYTGYTSPASIGHGHFHNTSGGVMIANHGGRQIPAYIPVSGPPHATISTPPAALSAPMMCGSSGRRHHHHHHHHHRGDRCQHYLQKAFHCAIRAMKAFYVSTTTSNRQSEQHGSATGASSAAVVPSGSSVSNNLRFSASPPHSDDVKWTLGVAKLLGHGAVTEYCNLIVGCIQSPFVLEEICKEVLLFYNKSNSQNGGSGSGSPPGPGPQDADPSPNPVVAATAAAVAAVVSGAAHHHPHPVSGPPNAVSAPSSAQVPTGASAPPPPVQVGSAPPADVSKLVSNVHNLYWQCIEHRLSHLAQQEWDDLVAIILAAHKAFRSLPPADPNLNWNNLLARIRNHPKCKKELWSRILSGIRTIQIG